MNRKYLILLAVVFAVAVIAAVFISIKQKQEAERIAKVENARQKMLASFGIASDGKSEFTALPPSLPHNPMAARIGRDLFQDGKLAANPRRTCGSCHWVNAGGTDDKAHGGLLTRPVMNAVFSSAFMHDGSIADLRSAITMMATNSAYSGCAGIEQAAMRLNADAKWAKRFQAVLGEPANTSNVVKAIATYLRTMIGPCNAFDAYLGGRKDALSTSQQAGMKTFGRHCVCCHSGPALGNRKMHEGKKVPSLRGVSRRRAYLTDASRNDLSTVVTLMPVEELSDAEKPSLLDFLRAL